MWLDVGNNNKQKMETTHLSPSLYNSTPPSSGPDEHKSRVSCWPYPQQEKKSQPTNYSYRKVENRCSMDKRPIIKRRFGRDNVNTAMRWSRLLVFIRSSIYIHSFNLFWRNTVSRICNAPNSHPRVYLIICYTYKKRHSFILREFSVLYTSQLSSFFNIEGGKEEIKYQVDRQASYVRQIGMCTLHRLLPICRWYHIPEAHI